MINSYAVDYSAQPLVLSRAEPIFTRRGIQYQNYRGSQAHYPEHESSMIHLLRDRLGRFYIAYKFEISEGDGVLTDSYTSEIHGTIYTAGNDYEFRYTGYDDPDVVNVTLIPVHLVSTEEVIPMNHEIDSVPASGATSETTITATKLLVKGKIMGGGLTSPVKV